MVDGCAKVAHVFGLVNAGVLLVDATEIALVAFDKTSRKTAWELPSIYN